MKSKISTQDNDVASDSDSTANSTNSTSQSPKVDNDAVKREAIEALRNQGLLPMITMSSTRFVHVEHSSYTSWYSSSSSSSSGVDECSTESRSDSSEDEDENDEDDCGVDDDYDHDENHLGIPGEMAAGLAEYETATQCCHRAPLVYETSMVVGTEGWVSNLRPEKQSVSLARTSCCGDNEEEEGERTCPVGWTTTTTTTIPNRPKVKNNRNSHHINNEWQQRQSEALFLSNLSRRCICFVEKPQIREFEALPLHLYADLFYSCHQLQKMMDEANAEKHQQQQQQQESSPVREAIL